MTVREFENESGQNLIEYGLIVGLIALGSIAILHTFGPILLNLVYSSSLAVYNAWPH